MYILGIDTSTRVAGAAVVGDGRLVAERFIHNLQTHSQNIIPMIQQVMGDSGITPQDLGGIAVTGGPGSFTGLRIGMSVAKTMALALNIPVTAVSTLEVLAWNLYRTVGFICPVLDAKKNEVYTCIYSSAGQGLTELIKPAALSIDVLIEEVSRFKEPVTFLGDGVPVFGDTIRERLGQQALFATKINSFPRASAAAELGLAQIMESTPGDPTFLQPVYLRKSEAEITWEQKNMCAESEMNL